MSKIIQPFGKIIRSVKIETDVKGLTRMTAETVNPITGQRGPVPAIELCAMLSQAATAQIIAVMKAITERKSVVDDGQETQEESKPHTH